MLLRLALSLIIWACMAVPPPPRIAIVGDSHMEILGPTLVRRFRARGIRATYLARRGWGIRSFQNEDDLLRTWLRQQRPTLVIFALGSNDYGIARTRLYRPRLEWAVAQAPRRADIIWYGPTFVTPSEEREARARNHDRVAEMQEEVFADNARVTWVDSRLVSEDYIGPDGFHLRRRGYSAWATHVVELVVRRY